MCYKLYFNPYIKVLNEFVVCYINSIDNLDFNDGEQSTAEGIGGPLANNEVDISMKEATKIERVNGIWDLIIIIIFICNLLILKVLYSILAHVKHIENAILISYQQFMDIFIYYHVLKVINSFELDI